MSELNKQIEDLQQQRDQYLHIAHDLYMALANLRTCKPCRERGLDAMRQYEQTFDNNQGQ